MGEVDADVVVGEIGDRARRCRGPGGAGERRAALGGHRGTHHGEQCQAPGGSGGRQQPTGALPPDQPAAPVKMRKVTVSTSSALPRWIATDQGLLRSSTVRPPRAPWTSEQDDAVRHRRWRGRGARRRRRKVSDRQQQDERADEHARDQAVHPFQHDLGVGVAEVRARPRGRTAAAPSGRSRWASRGRTGPNWWCGPRHPGRSGRRSGPR